MSRRAAARLKPIEAVWMEDFEGYKTIYLETEEFVRPVLFANDTHDNVLKGYTSLGKFINKGILHGPLSHRGRITYAHRQSLDTLCIEGVLYERLPYEIKGTDTILLKEIK